MTESEPRALQSSLWQKSLGNTKAGFDYLWRQADKLGDPVNRWSNKIGSEAFWPTTLDRESDKAARILQSFCKDGFYSEESRKATSKDEVKGKQRVVKKIPQKVIREARGLAIFTTMRSGLWISGAGGSGVVVARKEDGTWSEPAGILLHTAGLGWLIGVDIYDCVLVLRTQKAVDAFRHMRWTVGGELSAVAGPYGAGGYIETELHKRQAPIFTYLKSRGFYAGVQVDGTVVIERTDENARFYGGRISSTDILAGKARHAPIRELRMLKATLKAAQGDEVDPFMLPTGPAPADHEVEESGHVFGVPDKEDPDPFGIHALEQEGLKVKDAATHSEAPEEEFEFHPSEKSPIYTTYYHKAANEDLEKEKIKILRKVPPPYEGPRTTAVAEEHIDLAEPRGSLDVGIQTVDLDASHSIAAAPVGEELGDRNSQPKKAPPALPPRTPVQVQPIQLEDNEASETYAPTSSRNEDESLDNESTEQPTDLPLGEMPPETASHDTAASIELNGDSTGEKRDLGNEVQQVERTEVAEHRVPGGFD